MNRISNTMKGFLIKTSLFLFSSLSVSAQVNNVEEFFKAHPLPIYQDIIIKNKVISQGTDLCAPRYELIKPILDQYNNQFRLLDLGAAQGYFSFRIAREYPQSYCVMVDANTSYVHYTKHGEILYDLCHLNSDLTNFCYIDKALTISDLSYLNDHEHFDIVLAFLVVHLMYNDLSDQAQVIDALLSLGDNVIIEVANDVARPLTDYVQSLSTKIECDYLGEVKRHYSPESHATGKLFWFRKNPSSKTVSTKLKEEVAEYLNMVYPDMNTHE